MHFDLENKYHRAIYTSHICSLFYDEFLKDCWDKTFSSRTSEKRPCGYSQSLDAPTESCPYNAPGEGFTCTPQQAKLRLAHTLKHVKAGHKRVLADGVDGKWDHHRHVLAHGRKHTRSRSTHPR